MLKKDEFAKNSKAWCGLNKPNMKEEEADVILFGIPFDGGVSYRGGAAEAPDMLRKNTLSSTPSTERLKYYDELNIVDAGDFKDGTRDEIFKEVETYTEKLVRAGKKFIMVGGDHSVTIPVERGINNALDEEFGIIHIDAHMDLCEALEGDPLSHGSTERRALELKNISGLENLFFIGIRSIEEDEFSFMQENKIQVKTAYDCYHEGIEKVADDCIKAMSKYKKTYITFDIDALDPAYAAGTGTPQFGGLTSRMVMTLIEKLFTNLNVIGFDVVEIAPSLDPSLASMFAGRKLLQEIWGYWADEIGKLKK
ncbi:agmatinase [Anaerovorax sp. IOR16]|uniref:agmatinase n=1 Tax=Anaerovorax sp. IOR16 TaxID=2773458 RepID=UPI0019CF4E9F|nr:agmatinase [Anaerovorax sp. IOR16]